MEFVNYQIEQDEYCLIKSRNSTNASSHLLNIVLAGSGEIQDGELILLFPHFTNISFLDMITQHETDRTL